MPVVSTVKLATDPATNVPATLTGVLCVAIVVTVELPCIDTKAFISSAIDVILIPLVLDTATLIPLPATILAIVGDAAVVFKRIGKPSALAVKLWLICAPFDAVTEVIIPEPSSKLLILLTVPSISSTGVPVPEPAVTILPVTPRPATKLV